MTARFGLIGAGGIARAYTQVFDGLEEAALVAVADVRARNADALAEQVGGTSYPSHRALLEEADVDAVLVCTPPATHPEIALRAIERGRHVLCEKPLAVDVASARSMIAAADDAGVLFTMATKFRFVEDMVRAKQVLASGILGDLIQLENVFASRVDMTRTWHSQPAISGGGVLIDNGTHSIDIARYFLGPIAEVLAVEATRAQNLPVEDTVQLLVRTEDGVLGAIDLSWSYDKANDSYLELYGTEGTVRVGWRDSRYRQATTSEWVVFGDGYDKVTCMRSQVRNFCAAMQGEAKLAITAADAIASVLVVEAAYESLATGRWVGVAGVGDDADDADEDDEDGARGAQVA
jgi:predicted dehydrogenase